MVEAFIIISGKVQTVGFREFVKQYADELNLFGYVQNQDNGEVEVVVQGKKDTILILIDHLWKGPVFSEVKNIVVEWSYNMQDSFTSFEIWR